MKNTKRLAIGLLVQTHLVPLASASCGAAFCTVNSQWGLQGERIRSGWALDLRYESVNLDQPRHGTDAVAVGEIPRHHDEVDTTNHNTLLTIQNDNTTEGWGIALTLPVVKREHYHLHQHHGAVLDERWEFAKIGDARILGYYQADAWPIGIMAGLKLPTGEMNVDNADGDLAERTLQPGSGTTDLLIGGYWRSNQAHSPHSTFTELLWQQALNEKAEFQPGYRLTIDMGYRYALTSTMGLMAQINALIRGKDSGKLAEPEDSGSASVWFSVGTGYAINTQWQFYAFAQWPLVQNVQGVQLTADVSWLMGLRYHF